MAQEIGLHSLKPKPGSRRPRKRVGRGEGSGLGKTAGRGEKGAGARSGSKTRPNAEGGQMPIHMRMRKLRGPHMKKSMPFENFRTHTQPVNLADLEARFDDEGEVGQQKITQYTRYLTVGLAFAQSIGYVFLFRTFASDANTKVINNFNIGSVLLIVLTLTAGTVFVMWLGELITQRGIGNGISLMIFASIVARIPHGVNAWWNNPDQVFKVMMPLIALAVIAAIVYIQEGQRRIPVQYAKRVVGRRMAGGGSTYLPLRVNMAGVIPVIFAASLMAFPPTIGQLVQKGWARDFANFLNPNGAAYVIGESLLIIVFTYFYTAVTFNPVEQADNLKKYGGFIPGVRPGRPTAEFLDRILARLTFPGALYLAAVAGLPAGP